jgi:transforming growth factor-beta-induced protein
MYKKALSLLVAVVLLFTAVPFVQAAHHESIVDVAVNDGRFTTLVAAVVYTDLADALSGGEWTVFAPTDDAFAKLGLNADNIASKFSKADLTDILLYHALSGEVNSDKALTVLGDVTMVNGKKAGLKYFDGDIYVNDDAKVIIPDVNANNGVIHVVDTVILGPWPRTEEAPMAAAGTSAAGGSIVDIAVADGRFTTLVAAVTATGLADALSGGEWTVFAPTDDAFAKLGLNASNVAGAFSKADLTDILLYHALTSEVSSSKALTLLGDVAMANGKLAGLKYFDGDIYVNDDAKVIIPDIVASNGVIHVVDTVILPPWPRASE